MIFFSSPHCRKPIASILIACLFFPLLGIGALAPQKAQAMCPVFVTADAPQEKKTAMDKAWQALDQAYQKGGLTQAITTAGELIWSNAQKLAEWGLGAALNLLLHQILAKLTNDIVKWIQNGTEPRFLSQGLGDWLLDAADKAGGAFLDQYLGAGWLCEPFDIDIRVALLPVPTFDERVRCTLSDMGRNLNNFFDDFSNGGWAEWIQLTQPQNNFYGALLLAQEEKARVEAQEREEQDKELAMGDGYLAVKDCYWYDKAGALVATQKDVVGAPSLPAECRPNPNSPGYTQGGHRAPCTKKCKIKTPAAAVETMVNESITDFQKTIREQIGAATAKAGPFQVYVQAIANALINRVMTEGVGLLKSFTSDDPAGQFSNPSGSGAAGSLAQIVNAQTAMEERDHAILLLSAFQTIRDNLKFELLTEQQTNTAVNILIRSAYQTDTLPAIGNVLTYCQNIYPNYIAWANNNISNINNNLLPNLNAAINAAQNTEIPYTLETVRLINEVFSYSLQDFIDAADNWLTVYEQTQGVNTAPLASAGVAMNNAATQAVADTQELAVRTTNNTFSDSLKGLYQEMISANTTVIADALYLEQQRGSSSFPAAGTLYGDLETAQAVKTEANGYTAACQSYSGTGTGTINNTPTD